MPLNYRDATDLDVAPVSGGMACTLEQLVVFPKHRHFMSLASG